MAVSAVAVLWYVASLVMYMPSILQNLFGASVFRIERKTLNTNYMNKGQRRPGRGYGIAKRE
jgi:hypothetical protein